MVTKVMEKIIRWNPLSVGHMYAGCAGYTDNHICPIYIDSKRTVIYV